MTTRQEIIAELRQRFANADEAFLDVIGMFEHVLARGGTVPAAVLMNAMAGITAAFGDVTGDERKLGDRARIGDVTFGDPPNPANLQYAFSTPFGTVMLERDIALRLQAIMGKVSDVPYEFPGKVEPDNN
jgi:hypothetical protein